MLADRALLKARGREYYEIRRHEEGHCNGWPQSHPNARHVPPDTQTVVSEMLLGHRPIDWDFVGGHLQPLPFFDQGFAHWRRWKRTAIFSLASKRSSGMDHAQQQERLSETERQIAEAKALISRQRGRTGPSHLA
jgi:hypothetical protein